MTMGFFSKIAVTWTLFLLRNSHALPDFREGVFCGLVDDVGISARKPHVLIDSSGTLSITPYHTDQPSVLILKDPKGQQKQYFCILKKFDQASKPGTDEEGTVVQVEFAGFGGHGKVLEDPCKEYARNADSSVGFDPTSPDEAKPPLDFSSSEMPSRLRESSASPSIKYQVLILGEMHSSRLPEFVRSPSFNLRGRSFNINGSSEEVLVKTNEDSSELRFSESVTNEARDSLTPGGRRRDGEDRNIQLEDANVEYTGSDLPSTDIILSEASEGSLLLGRESEGSPIVTALSHKDHIVPLFLRMDEYAQNFPSNESKKMDQQYSAFFDEQNQRKSLSGITHTDNKIESLRTSGESNQQKKILDYEGYRMENHAMPLTSRETADFGTLLPRSYLPNSVTIPSILSESSTATEDQTSTATETEDQTSTATGTEDQTSTATETEDQTSTATETENQTSTATETEDQTSTAPETEDQTSAATESVDQTSTATETEVQTLTATESEYQTSTATETEAPTTTVGSAETSSATTSKTEAVTTGSITELSTSAAGSTTSSATGSKALLCLAVVSLSALLVVA